MRRIIGAFLAASALGAATVLAQAAPVFRSAHSGFALEALRPDLKFGDFTTFSAGYFLSGYTTVGTDLKAIVEMPFAWADYKGATANSALGNPYVGVVMPKRTFTFELGGRIPLASENDYAGLVGAAGDIDRIEAFGTDLIPLQIGATFRTVAEQGFSLGLSANTAAWFMTDETNNELVGGYAADVRYDGSYARAGVRWNGRALLTENGSFNERTMHSLGVFADVRLGPVHPGVQFRVPLDRDQRDGLRWVLGVNLQVDLVTRPIVVAAAR